MKGDALNVTNVVYVGIVKYSEHCSCRGKKKMFIGVRITGEGKGGIVSHKRSV